MRAATSQTSQQPSLKEKHEPVSVGKGGGKRISLMVGCKSGSLNTWHQGLNIDLAFSHETRNRKLTRFLMEEKSVIQGMTMPKELARYKSGTVDGSEGRLGHSFSTCAVTTWRSGSQTVCLKKQTHVGDQNWDEISSLSVAFKKTSAFAHNPVKQTPVTTFKYLVVHCGYVYEYPNQLQAVQLG